MAALTVGVQLVVIFGSNLPAWQTLTARVQSAHWQICCVHQNLLVTFFGARPPGAENECRYLSESVQPVLQDLKEYSEKDKLRSLP